MLNRWQAIIWSNNGLFCWHTCICHSASMSYRFDNSRMLIELYLFCLTHWGLMIPYDITVIIGPANGLPPVRWKDWCWADILKIGELKETSVKIESKYEHFYSWKCIWKCCLENVSYFCFKVSMCWKWHMSFEFETNKLSGIGQDIVWVIMFPWSILGQCRYDQKCLLCAGPWS